MTIENTALALQARASVALGSSKVEAELVELAEKSKDIVSITNKDGRQECHAAAMAAREARINIEKAGKAAREDATAFSKAVIAEEKRLVDLIQPEETRLLTIRDGWDAKVKAEKEAAEALERDRIAEIKGRIEAFKGFPVTASTLGAAEARFILERLEKTSIDDSFSEFYGDAVEARGDAIHKLRDLVASKEQAEAEAARIKAEQEAEAARQEAEAARLKAERAQMEAERAELARQRKEIEDAQAEQRRITEARAEAERAEANRIAAEEIRKLDAERKVAAMAEAEKLAEEAKPICVQESANSETQPALTVASDTQSIGATIKLGELNARLELASVTADQLEKIGFKPVATDKNAKLYRESDFPTICRKLADGLLAKAFKKAA